MEPFVARSSSTRTAYGVPLGNGKCIVERDKALAMIEDIKTGLPAELAEARRLVSARDEFIGNAKREAESIRRAAEEKARALVDQQEIVRTARAKAAELENSAAARSDALRRAAMEIIDAALRRAEESAGTAYNELRSSRARFRSAAGAGEAARAPRQAEPEKAAEEQ